VAQAAFVRAERADGFLMQLGVVGARGVKIEAVKQMQDRERSAVKARGRDH
jgi:hypothetical protein